MFFYFSFYVWWWHQLVHASNQLIDTPANRDAVNMMKVILIYPNFFPLCLPFKGTPKLFFYCNEKWNTLVPKRTRKRKKHTKTIKTWSDVRYPSNWCSCKSLWNSLDLLLVCSSICTYLKWTYKHLNREYVNACSSHFIVSNHGYCWTPLPQRQDRTLRTLGCNSLSWELSYYTTSAFICCFSL